LIRLVVPGSIDQLTGGYRYDAALLKALQWSGVDAEAIEILNLDDPAELGLLMTDLQSTSPGPCHLIVDGLALARLHDLDPALLPRFSRAAAQVHSLSALVHHPLGDETGLEDEERQHLHALEAEALRHVDLIMTTSRHTSERVNALFSPQQTVVVVEPGVDRPPTLPKKEHGVGSQSLKLLCVASLIPRKGQDILIQALHRLPTLDVHCTLVGLLDRDPDYVRKIQGLIEELRLQNHVTLTGPLVDEALEQHWQAADVLVLPSWYEGYGMVLDEAAVRGVPVLVSTGGALAATFREGTGLQVPPGDIGALATAIERFARDSAFLASCRTTALAISYQQRSWEEAAAELCLALEILIPRNRRLDLFDSEWLALREPFDHKARAGNQAEQALKRWAQGLHDADRPLTVVDLGAGLGSNLRHLDACLAAESGGSLISARVAIDHDPAKLKALDQLPHTTVQAVDLRDTEMFKATIAAIINSEAATLLTGSALLDLVSESWISALLGVAGQHRAALFFTLSVDGSSTFSPPDEHDDVVQRLFNAHQQQADTPGPEAAHLLAALARSHHFEVIVDASDWHLDSAAGATDRQLLSKLLTGWREAVREQLAHEHFTHPDGRKARTGLQLLQLDAWCQRRMAQIRSGTLHLRLGHCDVLAIPGQPPDLSTY
tara:strand:- start:41518 stop:43509 length:1992 start_codon:yes stop_codon:yes gene_type:complete